MYYVISLTGIYDNYYELKFFNFFYDRSFIDIAETCNYLEIYFENTQDLVWHEDYDDINEYFGDDEDPFGPLLYKYQIFSDSFEYECDAIDFSLNEYDDFDMVILPFDVEFPIDVYFYHCDDSIQFSDYTLSRDWFKKFSKYYTFGTSTTIVWEDWY